MQSAKIKIHPRILLGNNEKKIDHVSNVYIIQRGCKTNKYNETVHDTEGYCVEKTFFFFAENTVLYNFA